LRPLGLATWRATHRDALLPPRRSLPNRPIRRPRLRPRSYRQIR